MDKRDDPRLVGGVSVSTYAAASVVSLRFFDAAGAFADGCANILGGPLPGPLAVTCHTTTTTSDAIVAWRSPTEMFVIDAEGAMVAELDAYAAGRTDGCMVDLTGGVWLASIKGARTPDLLQRLGATRAAAAGQAVTGRLAEVTVTSLCVRDGETVLLVDQAYGAHLQAWINQTLGDF